VGLGIPPAGQSVTLQRHFLPTGILFAGGVFVGCSAATPASVEAPTVEAPPPVKGPPVGPSQEPFSPEPPVKPTPTNAQSNPPASQPHFAHCAITYAKVDRRQRNVTSPGGPPGPMTETGQCRIEARCIARHDADTPGDGFVSLACKENECTCHLEPRPQPAPVVELHFRSECLTQEAANELIRERCMKGMQFDPEPPRPSDPPLERQG
jgi:hypothetical protein